MRRKRVVATLAALMAVAALGMLASSAGFPPGSRVRIELFELPGPSGAPVGPLRDGFLVDQLVEADPSHWAGSFAEGHSLVATYVGVDQATARRALTDAGVSSAVRLEARSVSRADADAVRDLIQGSGLWGGRISGLGFDPYRCVVEIEARRPGLELVRRLEEVTSGSDVPVRIHWQLHPPQGV